MLHLPRSDLFKPRFKSALPFVSLLHSATLFSRSVFTKLQLVRKSISSVSLRKPRLARLGLQSCSLLPSSVWADSHISLSQAGLLLFPFPLSRPYVSCGRRTLGLQGKHRSFWHMEAAYCLSSSPWGFRCWGAKKLPIHRFSYQGRADSLPQTPSRQAFWRQPMKAAEGQTLAIPALALMSFWTRWKRHELSFF